MQKEPTSSDLLWAMLCSLILGSMVSCSGGGSGSDNSASPVPIFGDVEMDITAYQEDETAASLSRWLTLADGSIRIDEVRVVVDEIDLRLTGETGASVDVNGPFVAKIVEDGVITRDVVPEIANISLLAGHYDRIRFKLKNISAEELPQELADDEIVQNHLPDHNMVIEGKFLESLTNDINGNGLRDEISFRVLLASETEIEIQGSSAFEIIADQTNYVSIAFRLDEWFLGMISQFQNLSDYALVDNVLVVSMDGSPAVQEILQGVDERITESSRVAHADVEQTTIEEAVDEGSTSGEAPPIESVDDADEGGNPADGEPAAESDD